MIDSSLQRIYSGEETVDIYGHVSLLRTQRNFMVQTEVSEYWMLDSHIQKTLFIAIKLVEFH